MSGVRVTSLRPKNPAVEIRGGIFLWNPVRAAKKGIRPLLGKAARILLILPPRNCYPDYAIGLVCVIVESIRIPLNLPLQRQIPEQPDYQKEY